MTEPEFARATGTRQILLPGYPGHPPTPVSNDNKLLRFYAGAIGGKTGFTDDARHTYIGAAQRGWRRLVVVLMRGEQRPVPMYQQGIRLLDYGFSRPTEQAIGQLTAAAPGAASRSGADDAGGAASPAASRAAPADGRRDRLAHPADHRRGRRRGPRDRGDPAARPVLTAQTRLIE